MLPRSRISLPKFLLRFPFWYPRKGASPLVLKSLAQIPAQLGSIAATFPSQSGSLLKNPSLRCSPCCLNPQACLVSSQTWRKYGSEAGDNLLDVNKEVDKINLKFAEAREEIEMAMESKDTVYFDEEAECARDATKEVMDMFETLLGKLPETERSALQRSMGLKIEQLKAELEQLND